MPITNAKFDRGSFKATLTGGNLTTAGALGSLANPEGRKLLVTALVIDKVAASTGAATVDAGIAANATTTSDALIDGAALNGAGVLTNGLNGGTNGKVQQVWLPNQFLTFTGSADSTGLNAVVTIDYVPID